MVDEILPEIIVGSLRKVLNPFLCVVIWLDITNVPHLDMEYLHKVVNKVRLRVELPDPLVFDLSESQVVPYLRICLRRVIIQLLEF